MPVFTLTLPPLTLLLLLTFLWFVLLALLLGAWFRPRRPPAPPPEREVRRKTPAPEVLEDDFPAQLPRPRIVRETRAKDKLAKDKLEAEEDAFADFDPKNRRDDFDF